MPGTTKIRPKVDVLTGTVIGATVFTAFASRGRPSMRSLAEQSGTEQGGTVVSFGLDG